MIRKFNAKVEEGNRDAKEKNGVLFTSLTVTASYLITENGSRAIPFITLFRQFPASLFRDTENKFNTKEGR